MNWLRISATKSRAFEPGGTIVANVFRAADGWIGSAAGKQSGVMEDESAARQWCEAALDPTARTA